MDMENKLHAFLWAPKEYYIWYILLSVASVVKVFRFKLHFAFSQNLCV